jgi:hypothetical protein
VSVASDTCFISKSLFEAFAQNDSSIFDSVMVIDFNIAIDFDIEVDCRVAGKEGQHVVEKGDSGINVGFPFTVEIQTQADFGFGSLAVL